MPEKGAVHVTYMGSSSALVDLSAVSLAELRTSVDPELKRSEARIVHEAGNPWFEALKMQSASGGSGC